jgi:type II secretory pathway predicted ATPase ExeA
MNGQLMRGALTRRTPYVFVMGRRMVMFKQYFGLTQNPFSKEVTERDLFLSADLREATSRLAHIVKTRGFFLLSAESGCGKTTALRQWCTSLNPATHKVIYIALSTVTVMDFYRGLIGGMGAVASHNKATMFIQLQELIASSFHERRQTPVFILDEAQCLSGAVLDDIRMIFNFKMDSESPFICVLAGHQSVRRRLQLTSNQALRQRFLGNYHMRGLAKDEVASYIETRFKVAGADAQGIFTPAATECLYAASSGLPRALNNLICASLTLAAVTDKRTIDEECVYQAERDMEI